MARTLAALLFCLLALPSSAGADTDYGRIAYVTDRNGNDEIYSTRIDTYFQETNLTDNPAADQIGRASCRERVEVSVVGVEVDKEPQTSEAASARDNTT